MYTKVHSMLNGRLGTEKPLSIEEICVRKLQTARYRAREQMAISTYDSVSSGCEEVKKADSRWQRKVSMKSHSDKSCALHPPTFHGKVLPI